MTSFIAFALGVARCDRGCPSGDLLATPLPPPCPQAAGQNIQTIDP